MQITDRSKDVIKSGGEWISSIEIENLAVGCPGVAEAAVIGIPDEKWWEERGFFGFFLVFWCVFFRDSGVQQAATGVGSARYLLPLLGQRTRVSAHLM